MQYQFGPILDDVGATFRLWAPSPARVNLLLENRNPVAMQRQDSGFWIARADGASRGTRYKFSVDGYEFPDPASRQQAQSADGWSILRGSFRRKQHPGPLRPWHESVICEVHVGAVTPESTFRGLMGRLEHFRDAGYTSIELMPINQFPGARGWGYDCTLIFAPHHAYGAPEDLRALVDRAHELGLCVSADVVYNHFGSIDNFVPRYAPEWFDENIETPWGPAVNVREPAVRQFYCENACWLLEEYDFDGLRFDAVHEIATEARDQFLGELARAARAVKPDAKLVVENVKNQMHWLTRRDDDTPVDFTAQWNDDFHHVLQFLVSGEKTNGYDDPNRDPVADLEKSLTDGFVHDGDTDGKSDGRTRNEPASQLPMDAFIAFLQNHDQIGNRPDGKRIVERVDADRLDFGHFVTLLSPQIPLFFMGEEAHLRRGFLFFFDLPEPLADDKRRDRYQQMEKIFQTKVEPGTLPDPQALDTFERSKLDWDAYGHDQHRKALDRFRELCALRRELVWPLSATKCLNSSCARQGDGLIITWQYAAGTYNMALSPTGSDTHLKLSMFQVAASTGIFEREPGGIRLGPWSALVWRS